MTAGSGIVHSERTPPECPSVGKQSLRHPGLGRASFPARRGRRRLCALWRAGNSQDLCQRRRVHLDRRRVRRLDLAGENLLRHGLCGDRAYQRCAIPGQARTPRACDLRRRRRGRNCRPVRLVRRGRIDTAGAGRRDRAQGAGLPCRTTDADGRRALSEPRHIYWNFVSSSVERIEQAKTDWREGRFPPVPGEDEFIPLPED